MRRTQGRRQALRAGSPAVARQHALGRPLARLGRDRDGGPGVVDGLRRAHQAVELRVRRARARRQLQQGGQALDAGIVVVDVRHGAMPSASSAARIRSSPR